MCPAREIEALTERLLEASYLFEHPDSYAAGVLDTLDAVEPLLRPADDVVLRLYDEQPTAVAR